MSNEISKEQRLALSLASFDLARAPLLRSIENLISGAQKIGKSGAQCAVLKSHLEEVAHHADHLATIKWPAQ